MFKRARLTCLLTSLDKNVLIFNIFPLLSSEDAARLARTCRHLNQMVRKIVRFRLHYMYYSHPRQMRGFDTLETCWDDRFQEGYETLLSYGYTGESHYYMFDYQRNRFVLFNDFYIFSYNDTIWMDLVRKMEQSTEFDFQWRFLHFPTLPSNERHKVIKDVTLHRGDCLFVSWKARHSSFL